MDLPSWGHLTIHGGGQTRPQGAQTSHFVQMFQGRRASVPRSHRGRRPQTRRLNPVGFSFALSGRGDLLALSFRPLLSRCDRLRPGKSSGPTLFAPSLKVQRDDTHNPPPTKAFNTHCALKGPGRVRDKSADTGRNRSERPQKKKPGHRGLPGRPDSYVTFINGCGNRARIPMPRCAFSPSIRKGPVKWQTRSLTSARSEKARQRNFANTRTASGADTKSFG